VLMRNISYIITTYPCASETFIKREIARLIKEGFEIVVYASENKAGMSESGQEVNIHYKPFILSPAAVGSFIYMIFRHPLKLLTLFALITKLLFSCPKEAAIVCVNIHSICFFSRMVKKQNSEHIHACFLSWPTCIGLGISTLTKLPMSISAHARDIFVESGAMELKVKNASFVSCCTRQGLEYLKDKVNVLYHNRLFLNYHGIELDQEHTNYNCNEKKLSKFIVAVGRLVGKKGFIHLINALAELSRNHSDISLTIVGDGPQRQFLKGMIEKRALTDKVHLTGWLNHNKVLKLIEQAEILIVPSVIDSDGDRDGLPNVILEGFYTGTAVIASDLAGISEAVINEQTGLLVRAGDETALVNAVERLFTDQALANLLAKNAKEMLANHFNIENNCTKLAQAFIKGTNPENKNIKIAHIIEGFVGGMVTYLCNVLISLKKAGFDVTLIYSPKRGDNDSSKTINMLKGHGIKVYTVPMTRSIHPMIDLYCLIMLIKIFSRNRFDIIHTHCSKAGALGRIAARFTTTRKIFHSSHCFAFLRCGNVLSKKLYVILERYLADFTTKYIALSNSDAESAQHWKLFAEDKCVIINNGLPLNKTRQNESYRGAFQIRQIMNIPSESFVVATACRLVEYKGLFTFLEAAKLVKSNAIFVIAGDGPLKTKLEKYISINDMSDKVKLLGHVSDMDGLYNICDLVVLCSRREAQPYLLLEAMRAKCAIIASDVPGNRELLTDERGLLVEPSPGRFATAIDYLLSDKQTRTQLIQKSHKHFLDNHLLEDQIKKLVDTYLDKMITKERIYKVADTSPGKICSEIC